MASPTKPRRTQEERTAQTRLALIEGAVACIHEAGYAGANTAMIAERAGVSRGAMLHHFGTRAALMADVVRHVFEQEMTDYETIRLETGLGNHPYDWPRILWQVLNRPSGLAVLEILQATRSDPELAASVVPMQEEVEQAALAVMQRAFGGDAQQTMTLMRLMVWSVRGLSIADRHLPQRTETQAAVDLLVQLLKAAFERGDVPALAGMGAHA